MKLLRQVTLDRSNRRKDKSVSLTFITSLEQSPNEFMEIDTLLNASGVLYFKDSGNLSTEELKALDSSEIKVEGKSKSQRLRNVLYILHQQQKEVISFDEFYSLKMEKIIQYFKDKLEN